MAEKEAWPPSPGYTINSVLFYPFYTVFLAPIKDIPNPVPAPTTLLDWLSEPWASLIYTNKDLSKLITP